MIWPSVVPSFLASIVEFVEALTIVMVVGVTINWKSSLLGAAAATVTLAALVAAFGSTLVVFIPIDVLRLVIGIILILFGMQWLKKALLRASGLKALHDEAAIYEENMRQLKARGELNSNAFNGFGFATAFKSVLLEGLEVAFIVITFGATASTDKAQGLYAASVGAALAFIVVVALGLIVRGPLTRIPENALKFVVGVMLVTFGTFWAGEGLAVSWPFADLFLFALVAFYLALSAVIVRWLKAHAAQQKRKRKSKVKVRAAERAKPKPGPLVAFLNEVFDFFCGDWRIFWGTAGTLVIVALIGRLPELAVLEAVADVVFLAGAALSLALALKHEITE